MKKLRLDDALSGGLITILFTITVHTHTHTAQEHVSESLEAKICVCCAAWSP